MERDLFIEARPEVVFRLLTDPTEMLKWQGIDVQLEPQPGGIYRCRMNQLGHTPRWCAKTPPTGAPEPNEHKDRNTRD